MLTHFRKALLMGSAMPVILCAIAAMAMAQQAPAPVSIKPLKGDVYWVSGGSGSNNGVIVGKAGVVIVDSKQTEASEKEVAGEIAKLTPKPVNTAIITHSDGDHVNGLVAWPKGLTIIAQENCKKELETSIATGGRGAAPADYLPTKTVGKKESTTIDGVRFQLFHVAPAHTSGDLIVFLPAQKILFTGDLIVTLLPYPLIHLEKNGSSAGWIESVKAMLATDADMFVPGHGDPQTRAQIEARLKSTEDRRAQIKTMVDDGKSLAEIKQALGETAPAPGALPFPTFTEVVYKELAKN